MSVNIVNGVVYMIKGNSEYFKKKYGTSNPVIRIEDEDVNLWPGGWKQSLAAVCVIYSTRNALELLPVTGRVYYGKITCAPLNPISSPIEIGELVHESELEQYQGDTHQMPSSKNISFENSDPDL